MTRIFYVFLSKIPAGGKKRPQILRSAVYDDILVVLTLIGVVGISPTF